MRTFAPFSHINPNLFAVALTAALFGCVEGGGGVTNFLRPDGAVLGLDIGIAPGFTKTPDSPPSAASFELLTIRITSSSGDTLRDTLDWGSTSLSQSLPDATPSETSPLSLHPEYNLRPLRAWNVHLEALDAHGNVVLTGSAITGRIARGDTLRLPVSLLTPD